MQAFRPTARAPSGSRRLRPPSLLVLALVLALAPALAALSSCRGSSPSGKASPGGKAATGPTGRALSGKGRDGEAVLRRLASGALGSCEVTEHAVVRACTGDILERLRGQEDRIGPGRALRVLCKLLQHEEQRMRSLAASRIARLARPEVLRDVRDRELLRCFLEVLPVQHNASRARPVARAAALLACAMGEEDRIGEILEDAGLPEVQIAGVGALWALGRLRVMGVLSRAVAGGGQAALAAIHGLAEGAPASREEAAAACGLLLPLLTHGDSSIAGAATSRASALCPQERDALISAVQVRMARGDLDLDSINAVHALAGIDAAQSRRLAALYAAAVRDADSPIVRSTALRNLYELDPAAGMDLARANRDDPAYFVSSTARRILEQRSSVQSQGEH